MIKINTLQKIISLIFVATILLLFSACNSSETSSKKAQENEVYICPECNMQVKETNIYKASLTINNSTKYFDDIGCMILWCNEKNIDMRDVKVFSKDSHKYINAKDAYFKIGEKTPMMYGFAAYEKDIESSLTFEDVTIKMLRGENMRNPKIRKQILGHN